MENLINGNYVEILGLLPALTLLLMLAFIVHIDRYIRADLKRTMRIILIVVFSLVVQNYVEYRLADGEVRWLARTLVSIYGYAVRPVILILFLKMIAPQKCFLWAYVLVIVNAAVNATALFSHICFWIDERNHYQGGPLNDMCFYVSAILLVYWFVMKIRVFEPQKRKETWVPVLRLHWLWDRLNWTIMSVWFPSLYLSLQSLWSSAVWHITSGCICNSSGSMNRICRRSSGYRS